MDIQIARLLAAMLGADRSEPVMAMYLVLANERAKNDALHSIATFCFASEELSAFQVIMRIRGSLAKERHDLAHRLFGCVTEDAEGVAWISTADRLRNIREIDRILSTGQPFVFAESLHEKLRNVRSYVSFYTIEDLKRVESDFEEFMMLVAGFRSFVSYSGDDRLERLRGLCQQPLFVRFQSPST